MTGNRKIKGFYWTMICLMVVFALSLVFSVSFTGDNVIVFSSLLAANAGMFFGANFGEHWAKEKSK